MRENKKSYLAEDIDCMVDYQTGGSGCALQYVFGCALLTNIKKVRGVIHYDRHNYTLSDEDWLRVFKRSLRQAVEKVYEDNAAAIAKMTPTHVLNSFDVMCEDLVTNVLGYIKGELKRLGRYPTYKEFCKHWGGDDDAETPFNMEDIIYTP